MIFFKIIVVETNSLLSCQYYDKNRNATVRTGVEHCVRICCVRDYSLNIPLYRTILSLSCKEAMPEGEPE